MLRLLIIAVVLSILCRWVFGRWPWDYLASKPARSQDVLQARRLLGVSPEATREEIVEAHRQLVRQVHPDRGGTTAQVHEANAARDTLIDRLPEDEKSA